MSEDRISVDEFMVCGERAKSPAERAWVSRATATGGVVITARSHFAARYATQGEALIAAQEINKKKAAKDYVWRVVPCRVEIDLAPAFDHGDASPSA